MKRIFRLTPLAIVLSALSMSACSTIYFDRGKASPTALENSEWHHGGILRLVEFSSPVDLHERCEGKNWESVRVHQSFVAGFVSAVAAGIYEAWDVGYQCK